MGQFLFVYEKYTQKSLYSSLGTPTYLNEIGNKMKVKFFWICKKTFAVNDKLRGVWFISFKFSQ